MKKEQLLRAFSYLDGDLIERSEAAGRRAPWHKWTGMAACVALLAILAAGGMRQTDAQQARSAAQFASDYIPAPGETDVVTEPAVNGMPAMLPDSVGAAIGDSRPMIESYKTDADACYAPPKNGEVGLSMPLRGVIAENGDSARYRVVVDLFRDGQPLDADSGEAAAERERLAELGYTVAYETAYDHGGQVSAYFTLHATRDQLDTLPAGGYGYMLFLYGERVQDASQGVPEIVFSGAGASVDGAGVAVCPPDDSEALTAAEAYADADFGAYLCGAPAGFGEQEFRRAPEQLRASFRRGYDYVEWSVRMFQEEDRERLITAVTETEQYNVSLYTIPFAESVAAERRAVFDDPIFRVEDLTLDIVKARACRVNDAGDSGGWRSSFSVLCGDTLVQVNTKGVSPEWLYRELVSLP